MANRNWKYDLAVGLTVFITAILYAVAIGRIYS